MNANDVPNKSVEGNELQEVEPIGNLHGQPLQVGNALDEPFGNLHGQQTREPGLLTKEEIEALKEWLLSLQNKEV